jgi:hypothetical protein
MLSTDQARVVDPILTDHARGYTNAEFVGRVLFPQVDMPTRAAKRIQFDRASFRRYRTMRAPGAPIGQISFGYEGKAVSLTQHALSAVTPVEHQDEAGAVPGIDIQRENVDLVLAVIATEKEIAQATTARTAASYAASNKVALAGADKFSDETSNPLEVVSDFKETIRSRIGRRPNTLVLGGRVATILKRHPQLREHYKHTTSSTITDEMLRSFFDVAQLAVGDAIYDQEDGTTVDVWGNDLVLAYVPPTGARNMRLPSYGYTYQLRNHPFVEPPHYERGIRSWVNDVFDEYSAELVGADAGALIQNAI